RRGGRRSGSGRASGSRVARARRPGATGSACAPGGSRTAGSARPPGGAGFTGGAGSARPAGFARGARAAGAARRASGRAARCATRRAAGGAAGLLLLRPLLVRLAAIVGDVETRALEQQAGASRRYATRPAFALGALLGSLVADAMKQLEAMAALAALVVVGRHLQLLGESTRRR